jgi:hypothetical protein
MIPFSNGTDFMIWYERNCEKCIRAFFPKEGKDYPTDQTMKTYCFRGKECKLKYAIDVSVITGEITDDIAKKIGKREGFGLLNRCKEFSIDQNDAYKPKQLLKNKQNYKLF